MLEESHPCLSKHVVVSVTFKKVVQETLNFILILFKRDHAHEFAYLDDFIAVLILFNPSCIFEKSNIVANLIYNHAFLLLGHVFHELVSQPEDKSENHPLINKSF